MADIRQFKHPVKRPHAPLLASDPIPAWANLNPEARLIYLNIIRQLQHGVLLQCDRTFLALTAYMVDFAIRYDAGEEMADSIRESFAELLAPEIGQHYIERIQNRG